MFSYKGVYSSEKKEKKIHLMESGDLLQVNNCYNFDLGIPLTDLFFFLVALWKVLYFKCLEEYLKDYSSHQLRLSTQLETLLPQPLFGFVSETTSLELLTHCQAHSNFTDP